MKFETTFNINDHAWCMKNNTPIEVIISSIKIFYVNTNQDSIKYTARDIKNSVSWLDHEHLFESELFGTKQDLIQALFNVTAEPNGSSKQEIINICKE